ncbi:hypothetical protein [Asticcacaulis sp. EMRT-3]|uniref:hypothetical protein n=1 Tax=Asticcacaulis sp. EMRT-3 TaxID=3040349 RepID=UPI0024AED172|nr:hypothetical protein [Asticcacaulis sp. EMRT-3]MDI7776334.1 hypothetical protein [Asticcacaulis sp. EMRT-3]
MTMPTPHLPHCSVDAALDKQRSGYNAMILKTLRKATLGGLCVLTIWLFAALLGLVMVGHAEAATPDWQAERMDGHDLDESALKAARSVDSEQVAYTRMPQIIRRADATTCPHV